MSMKEKALLIKEDFDQLYDAGKQSVIDNSKYIEKSASGKVIRLDDVSEVAHKVVVKADTPTEVKVYGKNLFDGLLESGAIDSTTGNNLNTSTSTRSINYIPVIPNTTYTITREITSKNIRTRFYDQNKAYIGYGFSAVNTPMTFTAKEGYAFLRLELVGGTVDEKVQVEFGSATEYEPYTEQTITATPEGTEIPSVCPIMNFLADSEITVDYYSSYGRQAQRLEWWSKYLNDGKAQPSHMLFAGAGWDDTVFDPPFDINMSNSSSAFNSSRIEDLRGALQRNGVSLIFNDTNSAFTQHFSVFIQSRIKYMPYLKLPTTSSAYGWCTNCSSLVEVDGYECTENHTFETSSGANKTFQGCTNLEHIIFHGTIANTINMQDCKKLDLESLISLFRCIKTFWSTDEEYTKTIILSAESWALTQTQEFLDEFDGQEGKVLAHYFGWNVA